MAEINMYFKHYMQNKMASIVRRVRSIRHSVTCVMDPKGL